MSDPLAARQVDLNRSTAHCWTEFEAHRQRVMRLIDQHAPTAGSTLCILGAGNCNDLDLRWLCDRCAEVHLVDVDADSLRLAIQRQDVETSPLLRLHAPVDLTGMADRFARWMDAPPADAEISRTIDDLGEMGVLPSLHAGQCNLVVSTTVLSQLIDVARLTLPESHPLHVPLVLETRNAHLRLMAGLLRPGGMGLLICDLTSSDTCPALSIARDEDLGTVMLTAIQEQNFFTGVNPFAIHEVFRSDVRLADCTDLRIWQPWRWRLGTARDYLVYGLTFRRG
jgi:hypothetical protein